MMGSDCQWQCQLEFSVLCPGGSGPGCHGKGLCQDSTFKNLGRYGKFVDFESNNLSQAFCTWPPTYITSIEIIIII